MDLVLDESPRRAVTSTNVRHDDKAVLDRIQSWLKIRLNRDVKQWEMMSMVLAAALENSGADLLPPKP